MPSRSLSTPAARVTDLGGVANRYTVSQLVRYFASDLPPTSNYPRHDWAYIRYCLTNGFGIDGQSFLRYTAELPANRVAPIRRFLLFDQAIGSPVVVPDPKRTNGIPAGPFFPRTSQCRSLQKKAGQQVVASTIPTPGQAALNCLSGQSPPTI